MGQIFSNLWCWIWPKPRNEAPTSSNDDHKAKYQTLLSHHDENEQQSHRFNNSSDHHHDYVRLISGCSSHNEDYATNLWNWIRPKSKNKSPKSNDHNTKYQTLPQDDENQQQSHCINIPDQHVQLVSGSSLNETTENHENNNVDHSTPHIAIDLRSEMEEHAKKKSKSIQSSFKDQVILEPIVEKEVTTTSSKVSSVKKIGQYTSAQRILLVGEGDFSFSACLAVAFGNAANITATSLNSEDFLIKNYGKFISNKAELVSRGATVLHDVDAMKMSKHPLLGSQVFDRIIYNFPHNGNFGIDANDQSTHKKLVRGFIRNAKKMIKEDGEIHITSKSNGIYLQWDIPKIGRDQGLNLIQEIKFRVSKYPGYQTKYGFGGDKDKGF